MLPVQEGLADLERSLATSDTIRVFHSLTVGRFYPDVNRVLHTQQNKQLIRLHTTILQYMQAVQ